MQVDTLRLTEYRDRFKRPSETDVADLEKSIKESKEELEAELMISSLDMTCFETGVSVEFGHVAGAPLVSELLVDETVSSIQFDASKKHENKKMALGGAHVLVWAPDQVIDDSSLESLDPQLGFQGMQEEIANLEKTKAGPGAHYPLPLGLCQEIPNQSASPHSGQRHKQR